jgi:TonB family protein
MDVLKGEHATSTYREKGKNGVVLITSKNSVIEVPKGGVSDVKTIGPPPTTLIIADGVEISAEEMKKINPDNIESVNVIKGVQGIEKYGNKAKEGVIEITTKQVQEKVFTRAEQPAQFPGGDQAWKRYLDKNFRYPDAALKAGTEGTARLQFIVDETGWISNVKIVSDPGNGIGDEAMRLIKKGPKWQPALQNGRAVVYQVELLIPFKTPAY